MISVSNVDLPCWLGRSATKDEELVDSTYVVDDSFCLRTDSAEALPDKLRQATEIAIEVFAAHAMELNFGEGKTEAIIALRGRGAKYIKTHVSITFENKLPIESSQEY